VQLRLATILAFTAFLGAAAPRLRFEEYRDGFVTRTKNGAVRFDDDGVNIGGQLRMRVLRSRGAEPEGVDRLPGVTNRLIGSDPRRWEIGVAQYERLRYSNIYPGIDLIFYGNEQQLEFDFEVRPGADPRRVQMEFEGAKKVTTDRAGNLVLRIAAGEMQFRKPVVYQMVAGARREVRAEFVTKKRGRVGFEIAEYNHTRTLVIDPILAYATFLGGSGNDTASAIAVDGFGRAYVAGYTQSADLQTTTDVFQPNLAKQGRFDFDVFVAGLNATGTDLDFVTYLGGDGDDRAYRILLDGDGNIYVAGSTTSQNFPTTSGVFQTTAGSGFIAKLNGKGTALVYSTYVGGPVQGLATDSSGAVYAAGTSGSNAFAMKLTSDGSQAVYSMAFGGSGNTQGLGVAVDPSGNAYITGFTNAPDFPTTSGAVQFQYMGFNDGFVTEISPDGSTIIYSTFLGGTGDDQPSDIAVDSSGNAYVTGLTRSQDFPTTAGVARPTGHGQDAFLTKIDPTGSQFVFSTYLGGGDSNPKSHALALDRQGNIYTTGGAFYETAGPDSGDVVQVISPDGTAVLSRAAFPERLPSNGVAIAVDPFGNAYIAGMTEYAQAAGIVFELPIDTTPGVVEPTFRGGLLDAYVARISPVLIPPDGIKNVASLISGPVAPGEAITITGVTSTRGLHVFFDGVSEPIYTAPGFLLPISTQVPFAVDGQTSTVLQFESWGTRSDPVTLMVVPADPGIFATITNADGSTNSASIPAAQGSVITARATGCGQTDPPTADGQILTSSAQIHLPVTAAIGGVPATVIFAGAPAGTQANIVQIQVQVPDNAPSGQQMLVITVGGAVAPPVTVVIQ